MGKGSKRRPEAIKGSFDANWERVFVDSDVDKSMLTPHLCQKSAVETKSRVDNPDCG